LSLNATVKRECAVVCNTFAVAFSDRKRFKYLIDFKRFLTLKNVFIVFILLSLHYFLSDGTLIDFIKQLLGWLIVPFLSSLLKPGR
ncbi:hypothetical protein, partial [Klebsiella pneumoniae]|uniref:hypothetical protein n=1 Tax=Klebsiella pneumoniae TaxID=573 RepID=UPI002555FB20